MRSFNHAVRSTSRGKFARRSAARMLALVAASSAASVSRASVYNYTGANNGNWNLAGNWTLGGGTSNAVPGNGDTAVLGANVSGVSFAVFENKNYNSSGLGLLTINATGPIQFTLIQNTASTMVAMNESIGTTIYGNTYNQTAGSNTITDDLFLGSASNASSQGSYYLGGSGSLSARYVEVGLSPQTLAGGNSFTQTNGSNTCLQVVVGSSANGSGSYNLSGGTLNAGEIFVDGLSNSSNNVFTQSGSSSVITIGVVIGVAGGSPGATGTGVYNFISGTIDTSGAFAGGILVGGISATAQFNQTGGIAIFNSSLSSVNLGYLGGTGSYLLAGSGSISNVVDEEVGQTDAGTFNQSGSSTNTLASGGVLIVGDSGPGNYYLSSGNLNVTFGTECIANNSTGTFNQTGGSNFINFSSTFYVGLSNGSNGNYYLANGDLTITIGSELVGVDGTGTFTQVSGNNTIDNSFSALVVGAGAGVGTYSMQGGTLTSTAINVATASGTGSFNQTGGVANIGSLLAGSSNGGIGSVVVAGTGVLNISGGVTVLTGSKLVINSGGIVNLLPHGGSFSADVIALLTISGTGKLDVSNNALDLPGGSLLSTTQLVKQAYASGAWTGTGITSSLAASDTKHLTSLGVIQNNQSGVALYSGSHKFDNSSPNASDILVKCTFYGDTNLDGKVDGSDYSRIDSAYQSGGSGWFNGDFNYDNAINGSDYTLIDNAYNSQGTALTSEFASPQATPTAQLAGSIPATSVPEPALSAMASLAGLALLNRRRGQKGVTSQL